jgi:hypothetical protein
MESFVPYLPLQDGPSVCLLCNRREEEAETPIDTIEKLDTTLHSMEVRLKALEYEQTQHTLKAKRFHADGNDVRCKAELQLRHEKRQTYNRFVHLQTNIHRIRHCIDSTQSFGEIASHMGLANKILEDALKTVNPEKIDDLMDQLSENSIYVQEVGDALARNDDFDVDAAMQELEEEEEVPELPSVPSLPIQKTRVALIH